MHSNYRNYLLYFCPRRIKFKSIIFFIVLFILIIVFVDDRLNNHDNYNLEDDELDTYKREKYQNHPKNVFINDGKKFIDNSKEDYRETEQIVFPIITIPATPTPTTTIPTTTKQNKKIDIDVDVIQKHNSMEHQQRNHDKPNANVRNVDVSFDFDLPKINATRLLLDNSYRTYIQSLFFTDNANYSDVFASVNNKTGPNGDINVKECKCMQASCICCVSQVISDVEFEHDSCVNITYEKGYKNFIVDITSKQKHIYSTELPVEETPDLCLNASSLQYCLLFSESVFYKQIIAGCLHIRLKLVNLKTVLLDRHAGCYKLPSNSDLSWNEILFSNKTLLNIQNMNMNLANWIL